jgi:hypothetical protein
LKSGAGLPINRRGSNVVALVASYWWACHCKYIENTPNKTAAIPSAFFFMIVFVSEAPILGAPDPQSQGFIILEQNHGPWLFDPGRQSRIMRIAAGGWLALKTVMRLPQCGHPKTSIERTRLMSSDRE